MISAVVFERGWSEQKDTWRMNNSPFDPLSIAEKTEFLPL